jgi:acyl carrier protein
MKKLEVILENIFSIKSADISELESLKGLDSWDSLNHMLLITSLEREFEVELTPEEIISMDNIMQIKNILNMKLEITDVD